TMALSAMAISGCIFCSTCGVIGSPTRKAAVKRTVVSADDPAPMMMTDSWVRAVVDPRRRTAGRTQGAISSTSTTCSQNATVTDGYSSAKGDRQMADTPHSEAAMATSQL